MLFSRNEILEFIYEVHTHAYDFKQKTKPVLQSEPIEAGSFALGGDIARKNG